ncbi:MAG: hypothetical protein B6D36_17635 [Planctomycetes bacterium UTPLA1]|jgi:hypothetical protein|nr:MAG: hypothetical protein B6D36_17635 [Planctomycetes bacterium UTPLA1]
MLKSLNHLCARVVLAIGIVAVLPVLESFIVWIIVDRTMDRALLNTVAALLVAACGMFNGEHLVRTMFGVASLCDGGRLWRLVARALAWMLMSSAAGAVGGIAGHRLDLTGLIPAVIAHIPAPVAPQLVGLIYLAVPFTAAFLPVLIGGWLLQHTLTHYEDYGPRR